MALTRSSAERGPDVIVFSGNRANYSVVNNSGVYTVVDLRTNNPDGTQIVSGVEIFRFQDGELAPQLIHRSRLPWWKVLTMAI
ncbi:MAG: hypothetical protein U0936_16445 [Planctomycetaceae bacterium]